MTFEHLAEYVQIVLGILLISRLLNLQTSRMYLAFSCLIVADLFGSALWLITAHWTSLVRYFDYRLIWLFDRSLAWVFTVWTIALLLNAVLENYPGILGLSRKVLRYAWWAGALLGFVTAGWEYSASLSLAQSGWISYAMVLGIVLERVVSSTSLITMLILLGFLLWFPIRIPRNLAYLCIGFVVYFFIITSSFIARSFVWHDSPRLISVISVLMTATCYGLWFACLSKAGNTVPAQMTLNWDARHQQILIQQLDGLNHSLLRAARR